MKKDMTIIMDLQVTKVLKNMPDDIYNILVLHVQGLVEDCLNDAFDDVNINNVKVFEMGQKKKRRKKNK